MCLEQFSNCTVRNGSCYLRDHNELLHFLVITYEREKVTRLKSRILKRGGESIAATASPDDEEESKFIRKISRNALFVLAKDEYNRILIVEEVLVLVPLLVLQPPSLLGQLYIHGIFCLMVQRLNRAQEFLPDTVSQNCYLDKILTPRI